MIRVFLALSLCGLLIHSTASAIAITGVSQITANGGLTFDTGGAVISPGPAVLGDYVGPLGGNPNFVAIAVAVNSLGVSDQIQFTVTRDAILDSAEYQFAVTFTNALGSHHPLNGFDLRIAGGGTTVAALFETITDPISPPFTSMATGTASPFAFQSPNLGPVPGTAGPIRFGGLGGGGGFLVNDGSTVTQFFSVDITDVGAAVPMSLTLEFTANPEPSAMALAGLALCPVVLRRRRRNV